MRPTVICLSNVSVIGIQRVLSELLVCFSPDRHQTSSSLTIRCFHSETENDRAGGGLLSAGDSTQIKAYMCLIICSAL